MPPAWACLTTSLARDGMGERLPVVAMPPVHDRVLAPAAGQVGQQGGVLSPLGDDDVGFRDQFDRPDGEQPRIPRAGSDERDGPGRGRHCVG